MMTYDFRDGNGEVPAKRHINSDGKLGGWVADTAHVGSNAKVYEHAVVYGNATVFSDAQVYGNARVCGRANVYGDARVFDNARVYSRARVYGRANVYGDARVYGESHVFGNAHVLGNAQVYGYARVSGPVMLFGTTALCGNMRVGRNKYRHVTLSPIGSEGRSLTVAYSVEGELHCVVGCWDGPLKDLLQEAKARRCSDKQLKDYALAAQYAEHSLSKP